MFQSLPEEVREELGLNDSEVAAGDRPKRGNAKLSRAELNMDRQQQGR